MESLSGNLCHSRRQREKLFDFLRLFLLFGSPVVLSLILFLILVVIYNLRPFILGRGFTQTTCYVRGSEILNVTASCSAGTDLFQPCAQINVEYPTGGGFTTRGVLLENEQAMVNCNPCSYTFGKYGLYHQ
uniref:Uncharacterized protein n=1 Tax=Ciona savignyi TaxID=51511 RepID=H2ZP29_CIOSA